jgi:hypothetical protein
LPKVPPNPVRNLTIPDKSSEVYLTRPDYSPKVPNPI